MSSTLTKLSNPIAVLAATDKIAHEYTKDTIVYVASSTHIGRPLASHISLTKTCDVIINKFSLMELAHINYKRKFVRMGTPMNSFIALCRKLKHENIKNKANKRTYLKIMLEKLKGQ